MSEYEKVMKRLRSFGPYQVRIFILVSMFETPAAWAMLLPILLGAKPDWSCPASWKKNGTVGSNFSLDNKYAFSSNEDNQYNESDAPMQNYSWNSCTEDGLVCLGVQFDGSFTSIVSEWSLICDRESLSKHITTIQMVGVLFGVLITGQLADLFGRKKVLYLEYTLLLIVSLCSAFANSWQLFAAFRFVIGGLVGGVMVVNFVLPLEFVTPSWRTFCGCIGFWAVGLMTLALWGFFIKDWRILVICTSVSGIFLLFSWCFVPESPRWLLSKGRFDEAKDILSSIAKFNKRELPDLSALKSFAETERRIREQRNLYSYLDLFKTKQMTKNTLIVMYGWFVSSVVYYGLNFNTSNLAGNLYLNMFVSGLVEIPALIFVVCVNNRLGRRKTLSCLMLLAGISCLGVLFIGLAGSSSFLSILTIVFAMIGKSGISGGWAGTQVFSAETFPTVVRNIGVGACSMAARIGGIVAPQFVLLSDINKAIPFVIFGSLAFVFGLVVLLLPETSGKPLQDDLVVVKDSRKTENGFLPEEVPFQNKDC